jgi:hypothetical protein
VLFERAIIELSSLVASVTLLPPVSRKLGKEVELRTSRNLASFSF